MKEKLDFECELMYLDTIFWPIDSWLTIDLSVLLINYDSKIFYNSSTSTVLCNFHQWFHLVNPNYTHILEHLCFENILAKGEIAQDDFNFRFWHNVFNSIIIVSFMNIVNPFSKILYGKGRVNSLYLHRYSNQPICVYFNYSRI